MTLFAYPIRDWMSPAVPRPEALLQAAWVAVIIAASAQLLSGGLNFRRGGSDLVRRSRDEVGDELLAEVRTCALENNVDPRIAEAVLLTENLQRPAWVRRLERGRGLLFGAGSYGVMQSTADHPLTDSESIRRVVTHHLRDSQLSSTTSSGVTSPNVYGVGESLGGINRSDNWNSVLREVLEELAPPSGLTNEVYAYVGSTHMSASGSPILTLNRVGFDQGFVIVSLQTGQELAFPIEATLLNDSGEAVATVTAEQPGPSTDRLLFLNGSADAVALVVRAARGPELNGLTPACRFQLPPEWPRSLQVSTG